MPQLEEFTYDELEVQQAELLPAREAMLTINVANVTAVNMALALNVASPGAHAAALAAQEVTVAQFG